MALMRAAALVLGLALLFPAYAYDRYGRPCDAEIETLCWNVQAYGGWTAKCLEAHMAELTPSCGAIISRMVEQTGEVVAEACEDDARSLCFGTRPEATGACLLANRSRLSPVCAIKLFEAGF